MHKSSSSLSKVFKLIVLLWVTWFVDAIWMIYYVPHWLSDDLKDLQRGLHIAVILFSLINFLMKLAVILMLWFTERDTI